MQQILRQNLIFWWESITFGHVMKCKAVQQNGSRVTIYFLLLFSLQSEICEKKFPLLPSKNILTETTQLPQKYITESTSTRGNIFHIFRAQKVLSFYQVEPLFNTFQLHCLITQCHQTKHLYIKVQLGRNNGLKLGQRKLHTLCCSVFNL